MTDTRPPALSSSFSFQENNITFSAAGCLSPGSICHPKFMSLSHHTLDDDNTRRQTLGTKSKFRDGLCKTIGRCPVTCRSRAYGNIRGGPYSGFSSTQGRQLGRRPKRGQGVEQRGRNGIPLAGYEKKAYGVGGCCCYGAHPRSNTWIECRAQVTPCTQIDKRAQTHGLGTRPI